MLKEMVYYWPLWFSRVLSTKEQKKIKGVLPKIQNAQLMLWQALNIYDDFYDDEGVSSKLPQANKLMRNWLKIHYELHLPNDYYKLLNKLSDALDKSNQAEILSPKLAIKNKIVIIPQKLEEQKRASSLSSKSMTLALGQMALLAHLGYKMNSPKARATLDFFKYALSAKQLADDSYDWFEDLNKGLITLATRPIILAAKNKHLKINLKKSSALSFELFSEFASPQIIKKLNDLLRVARLKMSEINDTKNNSLIKRLILPLEAACEKAESFRFKIVEN